MNKLDTKKFNKTLKEATTWSAITEALTKLVLPLQNMILARLLVPEAFGVVAIVTMVTSFAEVFTYAGFQKYLIQSDYKDKQDQHKSANVAFWTNFAMSLIIVIFIFIFRNNLAELLGSPTSGLPIATGSIALLVISLSSIQMALFRREFNFKKLFIVRAFTIIVPLAVAIPLALLGFSYWSIIIATIAKHFVNAVLLTIFSDWQPKFYFSFKRLKEMFSFSSLTIVDGVLIWLTAWVDMFIIGRFFNEYYLGLYRTSISLVNSLMALVTATIVPVLYAALSRLKSDNKEFNNTFLKMQRIVGLILIPIGVGVFLFRDLATTVMLGNQWGEASIIIGIWALVSAARLVLISLNSEAFRAKGKPLIPALMQVIHLAVLIPVCLIFADRGFEQLVIARSVVRIQGLIIGLILMSFVIKVPVSKIIKNIVPIAVSTLIMGAAGYGLLLLGEAIWWQFVAIFICIIVYVASLMLFPQTRHTVVFYAKIGYNKIMKKKKTMENKNETE